MLYSGHVRSFSQPHVHLSHKEHLVEQLKSNCDVDVFMYLSGSVRTTALRYFKFYQVVNTGMKIPAEVVSSWSFDKRTNRQNTYKYDTSEMILVHSIEGIH